MNQGSLEKYLGLGQGKYKMNPEYDVAESEDVVDD